MKMTVIVYKKKLYEEFDIDFDVVLLTSFAEGNFVKRSTQRKIYFFLFTKTKIGPAKSKFISSFANANVGSLWYDPYRDLTEFRP